MKIRFDDNLVLVIIPESNLEKFALNKWHENFYGGDCSSILKVQTTCVETINQEVDNE